MNLNGPDPNLKSGFINCNKEDLLKGPVKIRLIKGISVELEKIAIPENIRAEANKIFIDNNFSVRKGQKMNYVLFYCIYHAYKNLGQVKVPKKIAALVGIPNTEIAKANSIFKSAGLLASQVRNCDTDDFISFPEFITDYCQDLGVDECTTAAIKQFGKELQEKYPDLDEKFPQNIAAGLIYYYLTIHIGEQDRKSFAAKVQLSDVTVNTAFNTIKSFHNS